MTEEINKQELPPFSSDVPPAEAGISLNWMMVDQNGCNIQATMRATFADDWKALIFRRSAFMMAALANGWSVGGPGPRPAAKDTPASPKPAPGGPKPAPQAAPKPKNAGPKETFEVQCVKLAIEPVDGGKAKVKFFDSDPNHRYPAIEGTKAAAKWADLTGWSQETFEEPVTYDGLDLVVGYTLSDKLNSKGNPYKDIEYIRL